MNSIDGIDPTIREALGVGVQRATTTRRKRRRADTECRKGEK